MPSATLPPLTPISIATEELDTLVRTLQAHGPEAAGRLLDAVPPSVAFEALVRLNQGFVQDILATFGRSGARPYLMPQHLSWRSNGSAIKISLPTPSAA